MSFIFHFLLIKLNSHSYGLLVLSQSFVVPMCVDSYHSNSILYVSCEAQELGKLSMAHSEVKVPGNVF